MPTEHAPDAEERRRGHAAELKPKMADELGAQQRRRSMQNIMVNTGSMRRTGCLECKKHYVAGKGGGVGGGGEGGGGMCIRRRTRDGNPDFRCDGCN
jgi:hypothetical protein